MPVFDDITVIDMTSGKAGALCTMFLSDNGARVIRMPIQQSLDRSHVEYATLDRGKELYPIDLHNKFDEFEKIISKADVIIDDLLVEDSDRKYLEYSKLKLINKRLIKCSITPYGEKGPLKNEPHIADLVKANIGMFQITPGYTNGPTYLIHPLIEVGTGLLAALGISSALFARLKSGHGMNINTSLFAGGLVYMPKATGDKVKTRSVKFTPVGGGPFYSVFECADGNWIQLGCIHAGFVDIAAAVMGISEVMLNPRYGDGRNPVDEEAREELFNIVKNTMKTKTSEVWGELFESADVPYAPVNSVQLAMQNQQIINNNMIHELNDPVYGPMNQLGLPIRFSKTPGEIIKPRTFDVSSSINILESNFSESFVNDTNITKYPLHGIKIADITNVIAGPAVGRMLADMGADVIKIETLNGDLSRAAASPSFHYLNSNKRSIAIDAKNDTASKVLTEIVSSCDVLVANLRPGATARMGLDSGKLLLKNSKMIEVHVTAFGWDGPFSHRPGVDPLAQALTGLEIAQGGEGNPPSMTGAPTDFTTGCLGALATVMALYVRDKMGFGQIVNTNLLNGGLLLLQGDFTTYKNKKKRRTSDSSQRGLGDFHRLYETKDGWIFVSAENHLIAKKMLSLLELSYELNPTDITLHTKLGVRIQNVIKTEVTVYWIDLMQRNNIPCSESRTGSDGLTHQTKSIESLFFNDRQFLENDFVSTHTFLDGSTYSFANGLIKFTDRDAPIPKPTPQLGEHTLEILEEFAVNQDTIAKMMLDGTIHVSKE